MINDYNMYTVAHTQTYICIGVFRMKNKKENPLEHLWNATIRPTSLKFY